MRASEKLRKEKDNAETQRTPRSPEKCEARKNGDVKPPL